jgi:hypothetical protein
VVTTDQAAARLGIRRCDVNHHHLGGRHCVLGNLLADTPVIEQDLRNGTERTLTEDEILRSGNSKKATSLPKSESTSEKVIVPAMCDVRIST